MIPTPQQHPSRPHFRAQLSSDIGLPPPIPLNSPKLPKVPARLALVLGDDREGASPFLAAAADLTVCLPASCGFGDDLPLPAAVALSLQVRGDTSLHPKFKSKIERGVRLRNRCTHGY